MKSKRIKPLHFQYKFDYLPSDGSYNCSLRKIMLWIALKTDFGATDYVCNTLSVQIIDSDQLKLNKLTTLYAQLLTYQTIIILFSLVFIVDRCIRIFTYIYSSSIQFAQTTWDKLENQEALLNYEIRNENILIHFQIK